MPLPWLIAWRFLAGHRSRLLDGTARAALAATTLGVMALVIAMALMSGYSRDLQAKLIGDNAAVGAYPLGREPEPLPPATLGELAAIPGVERVSRVVFGRGLITPANGGEAVEVTLRGVDPGADPRAAGEALATAGGLAGAVLGGELAHKLGLQMGDVARLTALGFADGRPRFRFQSLRVSGTFSSGFSEFDSSWLLVDRALAERMVGEEAGTVLYELVLTRPEDAATVAPQAETVLGPRYLVTDWRSLNRDLFEALRLQKIVLFLALGLIVLVSTFNVASTLMVLVRERMRDVGSLAAMGLAPRRIAGVFLAYGGILGLAGTGLGIAAGWAIAWLLTTFRVIRFSAEVAAIYFIDSVPFRVEPRDVAAIAGLALTLTLAACVLPALKAAGTPTAEALRYE